MKLSFTFILTLAVSLLLSVSSCNKGPTGGIPFYLKMDTAVVSAPRYISAESNTQNIKDVWVEAGAGNLGAYELSCNFPVLLKDSVHFTISPGIWESGQSEHPVIYPLMNPDVFTLAATPANVYTHVPTFSYKAADTILFNEDFESSSDYDNNMSTSTNNVKYGLRCGIITVSAADSSVTSYQQAYASPPVFSSRSAPYTLIPGKEIWLELDYRTDVPFWAGIIAHYTDGTRETIPVLFLLPTTKWTKEYIKLSEIVGQQGAYSYNLFFQGLNPVGSNGGSVYLDNIRLIYL